ncbi:uncharacterized protein LOC125075950 [Vanessa atalanta]|uniref:uncharacterized protein LOC125075950 n=1 Tax=Vanessa atalanta TaxID=42275 RepID=UPI001FCD513B|nr:uncharacterized protein LOC125075950 [Vanessa atalanta]
MLVDRNKKIKSQNENEKHERNLLTNEQTHQTNTRNQNTDTTQDRPCCCKAKEDRLRTATDISQRKVGSIVTELVTPIILKEAAAQGLSHETYINPQDNNIMRQPRLKMTQSNLKMPTPIRFCKIPPCNDVKNSNYHLVPICGSQKTSTNNTTTETTFKTCDCSPEKLMKLFEKSAKEISSKACNVCSIEIIDTKKLLSNECHARKCNNCRSKKSPEAVTSYEKKLKNVCPCEQQKLFIENDFEEKIDDKKSTSSKDRCKCLQIEKDQKHIKKNIICECPEPEPEPEIDFMDWIDEKEERRLKSDLTQTISGFRINIPRKKTDRENFEFEMSFEETLRYIAENLENESSKYNSDICSCKSDLKLQSKNVSVDCECPYEPYTPEAPEEETFEEEPFTGIKFHISGKGSGSKGLNGILCFRC